MKRMKKILILLMAAAMLLTGCVMRTVDQLYALPKRPQADSDLQTVIDQAMVGLSYSAPVYGENRQQLQSADLDGDGTDEFVVLARDGSRKTLKILIFRLLAVGYALSDVIEGYGSAYDFVEFANVDDHPGAEIIIGRQMGDGVVRSAAVYRVVDGTAQQLMEASYARFLCCDMDSDNRSELLLVEPGDTMDISTTLQLYRYDEGELRAVSQMQIDTPPSTTGSLEQISLMDETTAVLLTCQEADVQSIHFFSLYAGKLLAFHEPVEQRQVGGRFVSPVDIDGDGDTDIPKVIPVLDNEGAETGEHWIMWYGMNADGTVKDGIYTYYNYADKWYLHLDRPWTEQLLVTKSDGACTFTNRNKEIVMTIYALTGSSRRERAAQLGGVVLGSSQSVTFAAVVGPGAKALQITEQRIAQMFYPIDLKRYTEEG